MLISQKKFTSFKSRKRVEQASRPAVLRAHRPTETFRHPPRSDPNNHFEFHFVCSTRNVCRQKKQQRNSKLYVRVTSRKNKTAKSPDEGESYIAGKPCVTPAISKREESTKYLVVYLILFCSCRTNSRLPASWPVCCANRAQIRVGSTPAIPKEWRGNEAYLNTRRN